jgi:uncharacterized lipoprotein
VRTVTVGALVLLLLAGCGGTTTRRDFRHDADTVSSIAAEGALLAGEVEAGRTTTRFAKAHGTELGDTAAELASTLRRSRPVEPLPVGALARVADDVAQRLHRVAEHPPDPAATRLRAQLLRLSDRAARLSEAV